MFLKPSLGKGLKAKSALFKQISEHETHKHLSSHDNGSSVWLIVSLSIKNSGQIVLKTEQGHFGGPRNYADSFLPPNVMPVRLLIF